MHPISAKIQQLIKSTPKMTQAILADSIGISRATITRWFKDPREPEPEYKTVLKICDFFQLPPEYFYDELSPTYVGEFDNYKIVVEKDDPEDMGYFLDPDTTALAQDLANRPGMKTLLDASRNLSEEDLEIVNQLVQKLANK